MDAVTEGKMRIGPASDIEFVGLGKLGRISIRRPDDANHFFASMNFCICQLDIAKRRARDPLDRAVITQDFRNSRFD